MTEENILEELHHSWCNCSEETCHARESFQEAIKKVQKKERIKTLKEIIQEYQSNELEGKGYDFYFSIRVKIDEAINLIKND